MLFPSIMHVNDEHSFNYKNWDLRIFVRGKFDFDILNTTALSYANKTWSGNLLKETFTKYAEINDTYMYSDYYLEDGSFLKIDEITLGYNFKFKSKGFRNLRVYATGQNLVVYRLFREWSWLCIKYWYPEMK